MTIRHIHQRNEALCKHRRNKNWTQYVAAQICEVDLATYQNWEHGKIRPDFLHLWRLAEVFGATAKELGYTLMEDEKAAWMLLADLKETRIWNQRGKAS